MENSLIPGSWCLKGEKNAPYQKKYREKRRALIMFKKDGGHGTSNGKIISQLWDRGTIWLDIFSGGRGGM